MAKRKIHITESQLYEIMCRLNEVTLSGDENLSTRKGDATAAAKDTINNARRDGVPVQDNTNVSFSSDSLRKNGVTTEGKTFSKRQIKEARLQKLLNETQKKITKRNIR